MATPLLDHEVLKLENTNYMELLLATLQHFTSITATNYSEIFDNLNAQIHLENSSEERVQFKFRSDNILACSGSFSFKHGKLDSLTYAIKPASYFKKRVCKKQYQRVITMLTKISEVDRANIETISDEITKFHFNNGILTVTGGQHIITGTPMVSMIFQKA